MQVMIIYRGIVNFCCVTASRKIYCRDSKNDDSPFPYPFCNYVFPRQLLAQHVIASFKID